MLDTIKSLFIKKIYGNHNDTKNVKHAIKYVLGKMPADGVGLNIGAGFSKIDPKIRNMEIFEAPNIDFVGSVENIPLADEELDVVITQEVLEHVKSPFKAMNEIHRVLKIGGMAYIQLPFIIGFHPCPNDYWRFSKEGIEVLVQTSDMKIIESGITVGSATGFYRISVEFFSILFSVPIPSIYKLLKAILSILFYPIKLLDPILACSNEKDRVAGGYYIICQK